MQYCDCLVGAEAVRRAEYESTNANRTAYQLLTNIDIKAAISEELEKRAMSAGEAVMRMSRWAAGSMGTFMDESGDLVLDSDEAKAARHLIKKYKRKTITRYTADGSPVEEVNVEIELYDAKDAADKILQLHGRYKQLPGGGGTDNAVEYELPDGTKLRF